MDQQQASLDIRHVINALINGKWVIVATLLLTMTMAAISNYFQVLRYQAAAQLQIDAPPFLPNPGTDLNAQSGYYMNIERYFKTQKEKLNSRGMFILFASRLKDKDSSYQARSTESTAGEFGGGFSADPIEDTNLVTLRLIADNPNKAATWLNTYADLFVEENARQQEANVQKNREFLRAQLDEIKNLLSSQQGQISQLAGSASGTPPAEAAIAVDGDFLFSYQSAYEEARKKRLEEEQKLTKVEPFLAPGVDLTNIPTLDFSPNLRIYYDKMIEARAALEKLRLEGKGEQHPAVIVKMQESANVQEQLRTELRKTVDGLRLGISVLKTTEENALQSLNQRLAERKASARQMREISRIDKVRDNWTNASTLVEDKLRSLKVLENFVTNNMAVVERARPNPMPVSKRGLKFIFFMGICGFVLGTGIVVAGELLNPKVKTVEEIQTSLDVPALGFLPRTNDFSLSEIRESYNVLRTEVLFRRDTYKHRTLMVTSSVPQEGKTTVAFNLAKTLAAAGDRTVVLDFDLRKARLRSLMSSGSMNGARIFSPVEGLKLRLESTETRTLHLIVPATLPQHPPFILSQPEIRELVEYLRTRYDWVLVDAPPVTSVTDPVIIASLVDTILFVIKHNYVDKRIVRNSLAALSKVNANIMGAVLNDLDLKKMSYYSYQSYYRYYSESEAK